MELRIIRAAVRKAIVFGVLLRDRVRLLVSKVFSHSLLLLSISSSLLSFKRGWLFLVCYLRMPLRALHQPFKRLFLFKFL